MKNLMPLILVLICAFAIALNAQPTSFVHYQKDSCYTPQFDQNQLAPMSQQQIMDIASKPGVMTLKDKIAFKILQKAIRFQPFMENSCLGTSVFFSHGRFDFERTTKDGGVGEAIRTYRIATPGRFQIFWYEYGDGNKGAKLWKSNSGVQNWTLDQSCPTWEFVKKQNTNWLFIKFSGNSKGEALKHRLKRTLRALSKK